MLVSRITLTGPMSEIDRSVPVEELDGPELTRSDQVRLLRLYQRSHRLALAGRLPAGQAGVVLDPEGRVSGHKLDPIPSVIGYLHFNYTEITKALEALLGGASILVIGASGRLALQWSPLTLEVYGEGRDTHTQ